MMRNYSVLFAFFLLVGCGGADPYNPVAASDTYFCNNHHQIVISLGDHGKIAAISFEGRNVSLERVVDETYSNSIYTLYINADNGAVLEREGVPVYSGCTKGL